MKTKIVLWVMLATMLAGNWSCYPGGPEFIEDLDLVATEFDEEFDFAGVQTYFLLDSVAHIYEDDEDPTTVFDEDILSEIEANLNALGWVRQDADSDNDADLIIATTLIESTNSSIIWWDYWGWWPGWGYYPPGGCCWYPGYPWGGGTVYSYATGTLLIEMFDTNSIDPVEEEIDAVWLAAGNGLAQGTQAAARARLLDAINVSFSHPPFNN